MAINRCLDMQPIKRKIGFKLALDSWQIRGAWWHSCGASNSKKRGPGFDPHWRHHVVFLSKTNYLPRVLALSRHD